MLIYLRRQIAIVMEVDESSLDPDENLVDSGLDSLMAMEVIEQVQSDFDFNLFPRELYQRPTINALATYMATELKRCDGDPNVATTLCTAGSAQRVKPEAVVNKEAAAGNDRGGSSGVGIVHRPNPRPALSGPRIEDSVILLTAPRSGSTLLRVMMAGHSQLFSPPELHLLPFDRMSQRQQMLADSYLGEGLLRALIELQGIDADAASQQVEDWIRADLPVDEIYRVLKRLAGSRTLVDKSPTTTGRLETIQRAEAWFDRPKYVYLTRHPDAVIESLLRMRFDKLVGTQQDPYLWAEQVWLEAQQNACRFLDSVEPQRKCVLSFETLVAQPEATMRTLAAFLGVPYQEAMLTPYSGQRMTDGITASSRPIDDPNFLRHDRIDPAAANAWLDRPRPWTLSGQSVRIAEQLGYHLRHGISKPTVTTVTRSDVAATSGESPYFDYGGDGDGTSVHVPMSEKVIDTDRRSLCCCSWGSDRDPTVLCLHGILDQGMTWSLVAERLVRRGYHVVAPDFGGHGRSGHAGPSGWYSLLDFLSDADAVLRTLSADRVLLAGHSMGAVVAAQLALARSERIERLVAIEPPQPQASRRSMRDQLAAYLDQVAADSIHAIMDSLDAAVDRLRRAIPALSVDFARRLARRATRQTPEGWTWRWDARLRSRASLSLAAEQLGTTSFAALISQLPMPATVLLGAQSTHRRATMDDRTQYDTVNSIVIDGGHHLTIESADQVAAVIEGVALAQR
jgi:pimeloyl-ACP methyl ester carboxylesterase/aryl carrier-like protein